MDNKYTDNDIKVESSKNQKLENFWYYHKWHVIAIAFAAIVIAVCVYSCLAKPKTDITVLYAGPYSSADASVPYIIENLSAVMPESVGKNGADILILSKYTQEQAERLAKKSVAEYLEEEKKQGRHYTVEERENLIQRQIDQYNSITRSNQNSLSSYMGIGKYSICLLDPSIYEEYSGKGMFVLLSDIFGEENIPNSSYRDDAIRLCDTKLYRNNQSGIGNLPDDTLICLRIEPIMSGCAGGGNTEDYKKAIEMFIAMTK